MKLPLIKTLISGSAALAFAAGIITSHAAVIFSEDWQSSSVANNYRLQASDNGGFTGWTFPGNNVFRMNSHSTGAHPQDGLSPNWALQFEWGDQYARYDTTHAWADGDQFSVTFNATESSWNAQNDRYIGVRIRETVSNLLL